MSALLAGFGLGLAVAASFGPINLLALASGVRYGFRAAFGVGVGAVAADGTYAVLGGLGAAALLTGGARGWFQLVGGAALLLVAAGMLRGGVRPAREAEPGFRRTFAVALAATLANPLTIAYWAAAFAAVAPRLDLEPVEAATLLPAGVVAGGAAWATGFAAATALARRYVGERLLARLSLVSALTIAGFGAWFVVEGLRTLS